MVSTSVMTTPAWCTSFTDNRSQTLDDNHLGLGHPFTLRLGLLVFGRVVTSDSLLIGIELDHHATLWRSSPFLRLSPATPSQHTCAILGESRWRQADVFAVLIRVADVDVGNPISLHTDLLNSL